MRAWQHWYHITIGTYGTWLPGDPRGWREKDHRLHVEGDYKKPPVRTDFATAKHANAKQLMKHAPYIIKTEDKAAIGDLVLKSLTHQQIPVSTVAVSTINIHLLVQCKRDNPKPVAGNVKRQITFAMASVIDPTTSARQPMFEIECGAKPIRDLAHGKRAHRYILDHAKKENAWVWSHRQDDVLSTGPRRIATGLSARGGG